MASPNIKLETQVCENGLQSSQAAAWRRISDDGYNFVTPTPVNTNILAILNHGTIFTEREFGYAPIAYSASGKGYFEPQLGSLTIL